jgi:predicted small secreted protein
MEMKKFVVASAVLAASVLASCVATVETEVGIGYGLVHSHYVGVAEITTENDIVTEASFEEYFLPYSWAKVTETEGADHTVAVKSTSRTGAQVTTIYAEFIKIGDKIFTIEVTGEGFAQSFNYTSTGIDEVEAWVATEANAKWYVEQIQAGAYGFVDAEGDAITTFELADASAKVAMNKSDSGYWTVAAPGLGWSGNIAKIVELLVGSTMDFDPADFTKSSTAPLVWGNGTLTTGATLTDFKDYLSVALRAHANRVVEA